MDLHPAIDPNEIVLRRIAKVHMSDDWRSVRPEAFAPRQTDSGLSVFRLAFHTPLQVAREFRVPRPKAGPMWVAHLRVQDVLSLGLFVLPDPLEASGVLPAQPGHALIPQIRGTTARETRTLEWMRMLSSLVRPEDVDGPFEPPPMPE